MLRSVTVIVFLVGTLLLRPAILGGTYTSIGMVLVSCALFIHVVGHRGRFSITKQNAVVLATAVALWGYLLAHSWLMGVEHVDFTLKATLAHVVVLVAGAIVLSDPAVNRGYFRAFIGLMVASVVSYLVTVALSQFVPLGRLYLFQIPVEGGNYAGSGMTFFPFTTVYALMQAGSRLVPRMMSWFREAGIFQAFALWAYYSLPSYGMARPWLKLLLLIGVCAAVSTAGVALVPVCMAAALVFGQDQNARWQRFSRGVRAIVSVTLVGGSLLLAIYAPVVGFQDKYVVYGGSFTDRTQATMEGLKQFADNPFGTGAYGSSDIANAGVNLLSSSAAIGFVGIFLVVTAFFLPARYSLVKRRYLVAVIPLFLTLLLSQPIMDAPLVYLMFMGNNATLDETNTSQKRPGTVVA